MTNATRPPENSPVRRACILHAEDDRFTAVAISRFLAVQGFKVETAANGQEALTKFLASPSSFDLIITDQAMPVLSGEEWLARMRESGFMGKVIVYAASLTEGAASHLHELGVRKVIHKSESLQSLLGAIKESLEHP